MCDGDFIFMEEKELEMSTDGWYLGTSWITGCTGMFPGVYTERTAETETWTMHRCSKYRPRLMRYFYPE